MVAFPPFRVDLDDERLWRGTELLALRRKPFAILRFLIANPQRLVTHAELVEKVWGGTAISESALRSQMHELRQVLGDGVIETVIGRGYRFIAPIVDDPQAPSLVPAVAPAPASKRAVVGRAAELDALRAALDRARAGVRQVCFVTGEPGIGKTTLVDVFLEGAAGVVAARGHCIEQHGTPEPYLAVIELFGQLGHSEHGARVREALVRYAPTFLAQVPQLAPDAAVLDRGRGGNESRMVRELIEALEALSVQHPMVLVLEDLQWSDVATLDLLAVLGARRERARMLVVATARRGEANSVAHPLNRVMRTLVTRHGAGAVAVDRVGVPDIERLVAMRFPDHAFPPELPRALDRITAGTPLFLVSMLEDLVGRGMFAERDGRWHLTASLDDVAAHRPENVKQLIDMRIDRLGSTEQRVLEAASAIGAEFSTGLVAAALELGVEDVDEICDDLARRALFLRRAEPEQWPDGTLDMRYAVTHGLVQEVALARSAPVRVQRWHRLIAERLERAYAGRTDDIAHALAQQLDRAQLVARAVPYYVVAADRTAQRFASHDALNLYRRGLVLLQRVPESRERDIYELALLGGEVASTLRIGDPARVELEDQLERMILLARRLDDHPRLCAALLNLCFRYQLVANHRGSAEICRQVDELTAASRALRPELVAFASAMTALNRMWLGELDDVIPAFEALTESGSALEEPSLDILGPTDRRTVLYTFLAVVRWLVGRPDEARRGAERAVAHARTTTDPYGLALATCYAAWLRIASRDPDAGVQPVAELDAVEIWRGPAAWLAAAARGATGTDVDAIERAAGELRARIGRLPFGSTFLAVALVDALGRAGRTEAALALVDDALAFARRSAEHVVLPELLRQRGELLASEPEAAATALRDAIAAARTAGARMLELRAATSLARVAPGPDTRAALEAALERITGGSDTQDVVDARALLGLQ
jgi:DNA-binding winged helix-turn-helix (wHTH) protein